MSLACYQTSLDNFCLLLLAYLLLLLFRNVDREKVHAHIGEKSLQRSCRNGFVFPAHKADRMGMWMADGKL